MDKQATALSDAHSRVAHGTKRAAQAAEKAGNQLEVAMTIFHGN
jgi:chemotaxis regulatin CheY-phosphate phosphatase CheZ